MKLPEIFLDAINTCEGFDKEKLLNSHQAKPTVAVRFNPFKINKEEFLQYNYLQIDKPIPWSSFGFYLKERPSFTFDPLFHAGCYYVQEPSSMFLEEIIKQKIDSTQPLTALDLSAAPGGKTTHLLSLLNENSLLVSNEVIQARAEILKHNLIKWSKPNVVLTNNDPKDFAALNSFFDLLLLDVPCSGSGLFRKDEKAISEWSLENVNHCALRQKRIIADVLPALKENGLLIYSTCSYSKEENEENVKWMMKEFGLSLEKNKLNKTWGVLETEYGYRFWDYNVEGEGFFIAVLRKTKTIETIIQTNKPKQQIRDCDKKIAAEISTYFSKNDFSFWEFKNKYFAFPTLFSQQLKILAETLNLKYFGIETAELKGKDFIPLHPLALYPNSKTNFLQNNLDYDDAIHFLKKENIAQNLYPEKGWQLVGYKNKPLGWIKQLGNRVNNYFPNNYRIIKDLPLENN